MMASDTTMGVIIIIINRKGLNTTLTKGRETETVKKKRGSTHY